MNPLKKILADRFTRFYFDRYYFIGDRVQQINLMSFIIAKEKQIVSLCPIESLYTM